LESQSIFRRIFDREPVSSSWQSLSSSLVDVEPLEPTSLRDFFQSGLIGTMWGANIHRSDTIRQEVDRKMIDWLQMNVARSTMSCSMAEAALIRDPYNTDSLHYFADNLCTTIAEEEDRNMFDAITSNTTTMTEVDAPALTLDMINDAFDLIQPTNNLMCLNSNVAKKIVGNTGAKLENCFTIPIYSSEHCPNDAVYLLNNNMGVREPAAPSQLEWTEDHGKLRMYLNFTECWKIKIQSTDHRLIRRKRHRMEVLEIEENGREMLCTPVSVERFNKLEFD